MSAILFTYSVVIQEHHLDKFGHVNNAEYLVLLEDARWDFLNKNGFSMDDIKKFGFGPTILEIKIRFSRELKLHDEITIESQLMSYEKKIAKLFQKILRNGEVCCTAEYTMGLFDLKTRKLILPTKEWLRAIGFNHSRSS
jgi:thioesterase-3